MRSTTWVIDIDGTLVVKPPGPQQWAQGAKALPGAVEFINGLEKAGDRIILMTARKECVRRETESMLKRCGFVWDQLIMGVTNGPRIIINDGPCDHIQRKVNDARDLTSRGAEHKAKLQTDVGNPFG